ncbi:MAG: hypothetical protein QM426_10090 [Euryarchaeota archaeon]|nr:hypothetical protein [Euryarchaeota archaeon]
MVKFVHLFVLSTLIFWLAGSGCVGNDTSEVKETEIAPELTEAENIVPDSGARLTPAEIQEIDGDLAELENLLKNASVEEEILLEELRK